MNGSDIHFATGCFPRVVVYAPCWNEAPLLPYFLRHYAWAEKIVIFDNGSHDNSVEIATRFPNTEIRPLFTDSLFHEPALLQLKNHCWKEMRGTHVDFVIIVDVDEFLYSEDLAEELLRFKAEGINIARPTGYNMIAPRFPETQGSILEEVNQGVPCSGYSKCCLFQPDKVLEIAFGPGAHKCRPTGDLQWPQSTTLKLLHMRYLGVDYVISRNSQQEARRSPMNRQRGWGRHLERPPEKVREEYECLQQNAVSVVSGTNGTWCT